MKMRSLMLLTAIAAAMFSLSCAKKTAEPLAPEPGYVEYGK